MATTLKVKPKTVTEWARLGKIHAHGRAHRRVLVDYDEVMRHAENCGLLAV